MLLAFEALPKELERGREGGVITTAWSVTPEGKLFAERQHAHVREQARLFREWYPSHPTFVDELPASKVMPVNPDRKPEWVNDTEASLYKEYRAWCGAQKLDWISADELILEETLTEEQRCYLSAFLIRWDEALGRAA
ncbi:hypothetical protein B9J07_27915 [Sinorhizobium sp. LM21]|uniref:hypothetical protein n=1 Tax=Sinorhizobium sp. LM21 TaxID=1449788 RepID=UPI0005D94D18|nr:hypothetical protein [Sinorhizobium sp. LM21]AJW30181.1 hypothetical protein pLM21S1_p61 [Sinorhizobium sp. LM21]OWZ90416.1 hypothetical protein B9J07_27915 [Sinorhizobium sp. LM21]